jgi:nucleoside-diphosphate-sugar epimerase
LANNAIIFLTGGTGHLGHSLLPMLLEAGYHVRLLTRRPADHAWLAKFPVEIIEGQVEDADLMMRAVAGADYVVHGAGLFSFWGKNTRFAPTNVAGTANVLAAALQAKIKRFVHISTIVVVGIPGQAEIDETTPAKPVDPYQKTKYEGEQHALGYYQQHGLPVIVLRPGAFYGPHGHYAFNRLFIEDPLKGLRLKVYGGKRITFPVYTSDVAQGILLALQGGQAGQCYNICGQPLSHNEANAIISAEAGISSFRFNVPAWSMEALARAWTAFSTVTNVEPYYPINLKNYVFYNWRVSNQKARSQLGFKPTPFAEGIRHTLNWYRETGFLRRPSTGK